MSFHLKFRNNGNMEKFSVESKKIIKKVPAGTSAYQAAWILDDEDEDDDDEVVRLILFASVFFVIFFSTQFFQRFVPLLKHSVSEADASISRSMRFAACL